MSRKRHIDMNCGVAQALEQIGDWWTLLIIRDAFLGLSRFTQFERSLGISKNILTQRLNKLVEHEILERERLPEPGERYAYALTRKGKDLWVVLTAMRLWSDKWVFGEDAVPLVARDRATKRPLAKLMAVDPDGTPIAPRMLEWSPGPGITAPRPQPQTRDRDQPEDEPTP